MILIMGPITICQGFSSPLSSINLKYFSQTCPIKHTKKRRKWKEAEKVIDAANLNHFHYNLRAYDEIVGDRIGASITLHTNNILCTAWWLMMLRFTVEREMRRLKRKKKKWKEEKKNIRWRDSNIKWFQGNWHNNTHNACKESYWPGLEKKNFSFLCMHFNMTVMLLHDVHFYVICISLFEFIIIMRVASVDVWYFYFISTALGKREW